MLAAIFLAAAFVMIVIIAREEQKARTKRYEELMMDYPGLIMKFTLLVQAGMTVRNTFRKMASDYKNKMKNVLHMKSLLLPAMKWRVEFQKWKPIAALVKGADM